MSLRGVIDLELRPLLQKVTKGRRTIDHPFVLRSLSALLFRYFDLRPVKGPAMVTGKPVWA